MIEVYYIFRIIQKAGVQTGFIGCIELFRVASLEINREYDLSKNTKNTSEDIESDHEISKQLNIFILY